jgi:hypothetical protein
MKQPEYVEGQKAIENFEEGMKALFKVPKERVAKAAKKQASRRARKKKPKPSDKG